jgi:nucleolar protein 12
VRDVGQISTRGKEAKTGKREKVVGEPAGTSEPAGKKRKEKQKSKTKVVEVEEVSGDEDDDSLETKHLAEKNTHSDASDHDDDDDGANPSLPTHESLLPAKSKRIRSSKPKYAPSDETAYQRDLRTIFIGNLPLEVAQKKVCLLLVHSYLIYSEKENASVR